jgi:prepilin-type N-terminal cleavage/methylation domain-containing protein
MMNRNPQSGMTLLEVMIAVTLFAILSTGILMALRVSLNAMDHANDRLMSNRRAVYAARILESELNGFVPIVGLIQPTHETAMQQLNFFDGEPQSMRFVSTYSLQDALRGYPQILEFQVAPADHGIRLLVNEVPYTGAASAGSLAAGFAADPFTNQRYPIFRPIQTGPASFVLADKLAYCRFFFETPPLPSRPSAWVNHWTLPEWPIAIRIEMAPVDPDPSRLQPMTVTTAVHVNKNMGVQYADN